MIEDKSKPFYFYSKKTPLIISTKLFVFYWSKVFKTGWIRYNENGWGIHWTHVDNEMLYSERNGYCKMFTFLWYRFKYLKPSKIK